MLFQELLIISEVHPKSYSKFNCHISPVQCVPMVYIFIMDKYTYHWFSWFVNIPISWLTQEQNINRNVYIELSLSTHVLRLNSNNVIETNNFQWTRACMENHCKILHYFLKFCLHASVFKHLCPDIKVNGASIRPIWGHQDPCGPHELCFLGV